MTLFARNSSRSQRIRYAEALDRMQRPAPRWSETLDTLMFFTFVAWLGIVFTLGILFAVLF